MGVRPTLTVRLFIMDVSSTNATYSRYSFYTNNMPLKCMLYYLCYFSILIPLPGVVRTATAVLPISHTM
jgi:hypothetical protein